MPAHPYPCPVCDSETDRRFQKRGYWIRSCRYCHHHFAEVAASDEHVARVYSDEYFFGGRDGYPNYLAEGALLRDHGRRYARLLRTYMPSGSLLDVGCAAGFIMQGFHDNGWNVHGLEPNANMVARAVDSGLNVTLGTLETFRTTVRFDLVTMIQVVGHFYDLTSAIETAAALAYPAGFLLIETWDCESWMARLLGQHWHEYNPPSVIHYFSKKGLERLITKYGFEKIAAGRPLKRLNGQHAKSVLQYQLRNSRLGPLLEAGMSLVPDQLPIPYPAYDLFWTLFHKTASAIDL